MKKKTIINLLLTLVLVLIFINPILLASFSFIFFMGLTIFIILLNKEIPFISTVLLSIILGTYCFLNPPSTILANIILQGLPLLMSMTYAIFGCILYFFYKKRALKIIIFSIMSIFFLFMSYIIVMPTTAPPLN